MVILEGLQGAGKTSLFRVLGGTWYAEVCQKTFDPREFAMILPGKIIVEMGELHAFRTADIEQMKQFISTCTDSYRAPYDKGSKDWPRQNIFIGTTNHDTYLTDPTGGRRFWPIATGAIHLDYARQWRDQLFAEGYARLERGEPWHIVPDEAKEQQEVRRIMDPWEERLAAVGSKLYNGITTFHDVGGVLCIDRCVTRRTKNTYGSRDESQYDAGTIWLLQYLMRDLRATIENTYGRCRLVSDSTGTVPANCVTPNMMKGTLIAWYERHARAGLVENPELFAANVEVVRPAGDPNRLDATLPVDVANNLEVFAPLIAFQR